jgi:hypothetical protein
LSARCGECDDYVADLLGVALVTGIGLTVSLLVAESAAAVATNAPRMSGRFPAWLSHSCRVLTAAVLIRRNAVYPRGPTRVGRVVVGTDDSHTHQFM